MQTSVIAAPRTFQDLRITGTNISFETMIFNEEIGRKPALFILGSHEFVMPPSEAFCEELWRAGYQTVFVRRSGYGRSIPLPAPLLEDHSISSTATVTAEAALLSRFFGQYGQKGSALLSLGSSNPVAYRLCFMCQSISRFVFATPVFNQTVWDSFSPIWFRKMLQQTLSSQTGVQISSLGVKHQMRTHPLRFYRQILSRSAGDLHYIEQNEPDFTEAAKLAQHIDPKLLHYDIAASVDHDRLLMDGCFKGRPVIALSGVESKQSWREGLTNECERLGVPLKLAPSGDIFSAYVSPSTLIDCLRYETS